jgi:hypothetical protein
VDIVTATLPAPRQGLVLAHAILANGAILIVPLSEHLALNPAIGTCFGRLAAAAAAIFSPLFALLSLYSLGSGHSRQILHTLTSSRAHLLSATLSTKDLIRLTVCDTELVAKRM